MMKKLLLKNYEAKVGIDRRAVRALQKVLVYCGVRTVRWTIPTFLALFLAQTLLANKLPNVLFIFSDDHALRTIGAYGSGFHPTPNIDRLADEGAVFAQSFCGNSICQPSRAAILTGKHAHKNGVTDNGAPWDGSQQVFTRLLKQANYQTALFGKWHLVSDPTTEFDIWEIIVGAGRQGHYYNPTFRTQQGDVQREGYLTDLVAERCIQWLEKERDPKKPFFLMCQFKAPHVPRMPALRFLERYNDRTFSEPDTFLDDYASRKYASKAWMMIDGIGDVGLNIFAEDFDPMQHEYFSKMSPEQRTAYFAAYKKQNEEYFRFKAEGKLEGEAMKRYRYQRFIKDYLRCVDAIDENIGKLTQWLEACGFDKNTVVIYSSDQGYYTGEHGWAEKRWMYEESLKMPFVIRWPGIVQAGLRPEGMIQNIDYAPTFLDMAGLPVPADMQGRSFLPLLKGEMPNDWRSSIYYHYYAHGQHNVPRHYGVRTGRYKMMNFYTDNVWELYDLVQDPHELHNLYDDPTHAPARMALKSDLDRLQQLYEVPELPEEKRYPGLLCRPSEDGTMRLLPQTASLPQNGIRLSKIQDALSFWNNPNAVPRWNLSLKVGSYTLIVAYDGPNATSCVAQLGDTKVELKLPESGAWGTVKQYETNLKNKISGKTTFTLTPVPDAWKAINLRSVKLIPVR